VTFAAIAFQIALAFDPSAALGWVGKIALYLLILGLLIIFHELGHMVVAKRAGVTVSEFAFGFGPRLFGFERGGTLYSINLLPLGGFCKMVGEDTGDDGSADPGNFQHKPLYARMLVIIAGPFFNFILAAILFAIVGSVIGQPVATNVVATVKAGTPAAAVHLQPGDEIVGIDGQAFRSGAELVQYIHERPNTKMTFAVRHNGKIVYYHITTASQPGPGKKLGMFGFLPVLRSDRMNPVAGLLWGFEQVPKTIAEQWIGLVGVIASHDASALSGPVGLARVVGEATAYGVGNVIALAATLSVILGMFNLLPIPALDGGRLAFMVVELIRGRRVDPEKEGLVHLTGFALIMVLLAFITYHDIASWVSGKGPF
jgi:regulator of sigma E protease